MKKTRLTALALAWMIFASTVLGCAGMDYNATLQINWGISLPAAARYSQVFSQDSGPSFHGDGLRYHVFACGEPDPVEEMVPWQTRNAFAGAMEGWLDDLGVPPEVRPDDTACRYWCDTHDDGSRIVIAWDGSRVYVAECFL